MDNRLSELSNRIDEAFNAQEYRRAEFLFEGFKALIAKELDVKGTEYAALSPIDQVAVMVLQGITINEGAYSSNEGVRNIDLITRDVERAYAYADVFMAERSRRTKVNS